MPTDIGYVVKYGLLCSPPSHITLDPFITEVHSKCVGSVYCIEVKMAMIKNEQLQESSDLGGHEQKVLQALLSVHRPFNYLSLYLLVSFYSILLCQYTS